jgi:ATP-dependent DNA ligase
VAARRKAAAPPPPIDPALFAELAVKPTVAPMLAKRATVMPDGDRWIFEPKWDGFRAIVFRCDDATYVQSRDERPLDRYFPELAEALTKALPGRCVIDGEIVIAGEKGLEFESLQLRLHPAASRVAKLAAAMPSSFVAFDILCDGDEDLRDRPFAERRDRLEKRLAGVEPPLHLTPATRDRARADDWFHRFEGAGLDGVIAKDEASTYQPGQRVMMKVKHLRSCEAVVAGFRWHKNGDDEKVGSLLLGLYDAEGGLHHIGVTATFTDAKRKELKQTLAPYRDNALESHPWKDWAAAMIEAEAEGVRQPGGHSRWNAGKDMSWEPLRPELVAEVTYDHMQGSRFRHTAQFKCFRTDKKPSECTYDQLDVTPPAELRELFGQPVARDAT